MEITLTLENPDKRMQLFGQGDENLRMIRDICDVQITAREERVRFTGTNESVSQSVNLLNLMQERLRQVDHITKDDVLQLMQRERLQAKGVENPSKMEVYVQGRTIEARTVGQKDYVDAMNKNDMVFCTGPAGTGKTYLAVAMAVSMLKRGQIRRIILARPAVEAGEKLGFLPGDMQAKVNPYLRPLFDALGDMMNYEQVQQFVQNDVIEVVPLAFMRGRTLNEAAVILDEAQNTTVSQMLMFLTRMGNDSKMFITGDDSQTDLEARSKSGLTDATRRLKKLKGIGFIRLKQVDIVRHKLVQKIVNAYEVKK